LGRSSGSNPDVAAPSHGGVSGGHFDYDIYYAACTASASKYSCPHNTHVHEYDDKYNVTGVNMMNASTTAMNLNNAIPLTTTRFRILVANQKLSPAVNLNVGIAVAAGGSHTCAARIGGGARWFAALALGAASVFGFAPFHLSALPILTLALLFVLWRQSPSPRAAAAQGFAFGLGFFLTGTSWVYISLHTFGGMPAGLTAISTIGFCAVVACYPAIAGWLSLRLVPGFPAGRHTTILVLVVMPACWTAGELMRGYLLTGFPWLGLGYSQVPGSPLAGYAAVLGSYGVTWLTAICAGALGLVLLRLPAPSRLRARRPRTP
jgi:hypothetical protein